jgi:hypothetical protein
MQTIADVITQFIRRIEPKALAPEQLIDFKKKKQKKNKKKTGAISFSFYGFRYEGQVEITITWDFKYDIYFFQDEKLVRTIKAATYPELVEFLNWIEKGN